MEKVLMTLIECVQFLLFIIKLAWEQGLPITAWALLTETAKVPGLNRLVTIATSVRAEWCLSIAVGLGVMVVVGIVVGIVVATRPATKRKTAKNAFGRFFKWIMRTTMRIVAAIAIAALMFAAFIFAAAWVVR